MARCFIFLYISFVISAGSCKDPDSSADRGQPAQDPGIRLSSIPSSESGITFNNKINDEGSVNIFTWHFLYNGAGVAAGDINNDGLPDLYFSGNMVPDKLYINKGNFRFEDITSKAGIGTQVWSSGVTMADVNNDGLIDIYVCKNSPTGVQDNNRNKLYINMGNMVFREQAAQYGIDDIGFGVQAIFFDADNDGDLDMYLVNQPFDEFARLVNSPEVVAAYPQTDRLFYFENGKFTDKTASLGLTNARYGLNVSIGDFDMNGWTDIYVCNDYHHGDHLYMNDQGRFRDASHDRLGHISFYSMGSDVADVNNDGWLDIFTLDMAFEDHYRSKTNMGSMDPDRFWQLVEDKQHYQYMQNALQLNMGNGFFSEVAQVAGIAKSDWSYSSVFADLDHDGDQDILVTNGIYRDLRNNDFNVYVREKYQNQVGPDNYLEVLGKMPSTPIANIIFTNEGNLLFSKLPAEAAFSTKGFSHGMAVADLDLDGKQDVIINNLSAEASVYKNVSVTHGNYLTVRLEGPGTNLNGLGNTVILYAGGKQQAQTMQTSRGYLSSSEPLIHFGLGTAEKADSLKVYWNHREMSLLKNIPAGKTIDIKYAKEKKIPFHAPVYLHVKVSELQIEIVDQDMPYNDFGEQVLLPYKLSQNGPFVSTGDVNGDGLEDLFVGGAAGYPGRIYLQQSGGDFQKSHQPSLDTDKAAEDMESILADIDSDGDLDLLVISGSNEFKDHDPALRVRAYLNDGKGIFTVPAKNMIPDQKINGQCIELVDVDGDGDMDLFLGGRLVGGKYAVPASSKIWINHGDKFVDETARRAAFLDTFGMVTAVIAEDIDGDGDQDLLAVGEWMAPSWLINDGKGNFSLQEISVAGTGLWWSIEKGDFDSDGDMDFILGNLGWNNKFGGARGTKLEIYANDFDESGDYDVVLASTKNEKLLPVRGRECTSQEMPFILEKFPTYESYANAQLDEIYSPEQLAQSTHKKLSTMSSLFLRNDGGGQWSAKDLPVLCQTGPIKAFYAEDIDEDGSLDFIFAGNHFSAEVETARYDGLYPGICFGDGQGEFECRSLSVNGRLSIDDARDITMISTAKGDRIILMTTNNGPLRAYRFEKN